MEIRKCDRWLESSCIAGNGTQKNMVNGMKTGYMMGEKRDSTLT